MTCYMFSVVIYYHYKSCCSSLADLPIGKVIDLLFKLDTASLLYSVDRQPLTIIGQVLFLAAQIMDKFGEHRKYITAR
jgi:hypothetical protein